MGNTYGEKLEDWIVLENKTFSWTPAWQRYVDIPEYNIEQYCETHGAKKTTMANLPSRVYLELVISQKVKFQRSLQESNSPARFRHINNDSS